MPHKFTQADQRRLSGVWSTFNRRTYCAWEFDPATRTLKTRRGIAVHAATLESETRSLEELRDELPKMALQLLQTELPRH